MSQTAQPRQLSIHKERDKVGKRDQVIPPGLLNLEEGVLGSKEQITREGHLSRLLHVVAKVVLVPLGYSVIYKHNRGTVESCAVGTAQQYIIRFQVHVQVSDLVQ